MKAVGFYHKGNTMVDFNKINELKDYWCFVTDNSGGWYKIPVNYRFMFTQWLDAVENMNDVWDHPDFTQYRSMHPVSYMFKEITTLKER